MSEQNPEWRRVRFGEVVRLISDRCDPVASGVERFVGLEHIEPGDLRIRSWGNVADGTTFTNRFRPGQVLFGKRRAYQRKVAVADFEGVCSGDIYVLESADPERLLPELLPFICQTDAFFEYAVATSAGSLSPRTNWKSLADYEFALPPEEEQRGAVKVLRTAYESVNVYEKARQAAITCVRALDEEFFTNALETWPKKPLTELCSFYSRRHESSDKVYEVSSDFPHAVPVLRSLNVWPGRFDLAELRYISPEGNAVHSKLTLREGDLLIVRTGDAGRPGNAAVVPHSMAGWNCLDIILARPLPGVLPDYIVSALNRPSTLQYLTSLAPGTKQKHLTMTELHRLSIPVPPIDVQSDYVGRRIAMQRSVDAIANRVRSNRDLVRAALLAAFEAEHVY